MSATQQIQDWLHHTKVQDLVNDHKDGLIIVYTKEKLVDVVNVLAEKKILSVPAVNDHGECVGFIDVVTIAAYIVQTAPDIMDGIGHSIKQTTLGDLLQRHSLQTSAFASVSVQDSAWDAVMKLTSHVHRLGVHPVDQPREMISILSQSDIIRQLLREVALVDHEQQEHHHASVRSVEVKHFLSRKLRDLGVRAHRALGVVSGKEPVILALQNLVKHHWSALAVIDEHGVLIGNFSATDLRGLYQHHYPHFLMSVQSFLQKHSPNSLALQTVTLDETLLSALNKIVNNRIHRLWIVEHDKPVSVLTLTDVMKIMAGLPL